MAAVLAVLTTHMVMVILQRQVGTVVLHVCTELQPYTGHVVAVLSSIVSSYTVKAAVCNGNHLLFHLKHLLLLHAGFYKGRTADAIVAAIQERGGVMTKEDLSAHKCEHREPIMSTYRGYHIYEVAPPTAVRCQSKISHSIQYNLDLVIHS